MKNSDSIFPSGLGMYDYWDFIIGYINIETTRNFTMFNSIFENMDSY